MKLALVQMRVQSNNPQANFKTIRHFVEMHKHTADIIVFPELCVGGYLLGDQYFKEDVVSDLLAYNDMIKDLSQGTAIIWGNVALAPKGLYNAGYFAIDGAWAKRDHQATDGYYAKHLLPTYGVFEDDRYFNPGPADFQPFHYQDKKIALQICEDLWDREHNMSPTQAMLAYKPDAVVNISASPWVKGKESQRLDRIQEQRATVPFIYLNTVGMQNNGKNVVVFDGGSLVVSNTQVLCLPDGFVETSHVVDVFAFKAEDLTISDKLYEAMIQGIRYFDSETLPYKPKWIVGVSGGLDSSVSVALLTLALGKERVLGVTMPSQFTRDITKNNAYALHKSLGFVLKEIPIGDMVDATVRSLQIGEYSTVEGLSLENIQARLRGHTLMSIASLENGVVSNNGNKIEVALGYATLYGDAIGALAILGDLNKMEVGQLAQTINARVGQTIIPENLIPQDHEGVVSWGFAPSAELKEDQFDPMKWGYHDRLIDILMQSPLESFLSQYLDNSIFDTPLGVYIKQYGLDNPEAFVADLKWVLRTMNVAVYKRIQMPPILTVSNYAFGMEYRESQMPLNITQAQEQLFERILKK